MVQRSSRLYLLCIALSLACDDAQASSAPDGGMCLAALGCDAGAPDAGAPRALPLADVTGVKVSQMYCGAVRSSCGGGLGPTIDYAVDLAAATLTTTRCTPSDAGPAAHPQSSRPLSAAQLSEVRAALEAIRVVDAELTMLDGFMQSLTLTRADGSTRGYSPAAACGPRQYEQVVAGFDALWKLISSFDPP